MFRYVLIIGILAIFTSSVALGQTPTPTPTPIPSVRPSESGEYDIYTVTVPMLYSPVVLVILGVVGLLILVRAIIKFIPGVG